MLGRFKVSACSSCRGLKFLILCTECSTVSTIPSNPRLKVCRCGSFCSPQNYDQHGVNFGTSESLPHPGRCYRQKITPKPVAIIGPVIALSATAHQPHYRPHPS
ncbi:unnamed protein product [Fusarium graminearum]|uniref:Chromosome 1, complete genome n=2 Tax=Gibberella zeae TaxID=5518 RepID=I1S4U9_GIBZE|nr:hypothetical protein FGSG_11867 [Fusarium graminearum PH-1]CAF3601607.1 unnamed protein product [Fusarium graminearum]ESU06231.1 hypothetical protein FGSG_11867 [Fusarium graminearum PH-1]CAG1980689.1 unnamed protein product [Fusarium graminearum]CAG1990103.1 unnamed protein product [Fusarium graminearum]CEF73023.1 unnamed protein product [Fusarium graminearum]|eukprot:XP_011316716.1 hypothetical protein FGSG_11867 [Fusarium graminearum PH-1]